MLLLFFAKTTVVTDCSLLLTTTSICQLIRIGFAVLHQWMNFSQLAVNCAECSLFL